MERLGAALAAATMSFVGSTPLGTSTRSTTCSTPFVALLSAEVTVVTGTVLMVTAPVLALRSADSTGVQVVHRLASGVPAVEMDGEKTVTGSAWYVRTFVRPATLRGSVSQPTRGAGMLVKAASLR